MDKETKYIASCSFGKDSIATILLALEKNEPLDRVVSVEVMFDSERGISGEIPEHIEWVYGVAIPKLEGMGVKVDMLRSKKGLVQIFNRKFKNAHTKEKHGMCYGFPSGRGCYMNNEGKVQTINKYYKDLGKRYDIIQYIGIAADEGKRLARLEGNKVSLLAKYGYTEWMAMKLCKEYGLVSPIYDMGTRNGCWFCPNAEIERYISIRKNHPTLWNELKELDKEPNRWYKYFKYNKTLSDVERMMDDIESQLTLF